MAAIASPSASPCHLCSLSRAHKLQWRSQKLQWNPLRASPTPNWLRKELAQSYRRTGKPMQTPLRISRVEPVEIMSLMELKGAETEPTQHDSIITKLLSSPKTLVQKVSKKAIACVEETMKALQKPAILALAIGLLLSQAPDALAASGGMMGGRSFSSGRSSGSSARTFSAPSSSLSFSAPYAAPSPFFGGVFGPSIYIGPAYGLSVGGGGSFLLPILSFLTLFFVSGFLTNRTDSSLLISSRQTSVLKLQVGLLGMARSLQRDLDRTADRANTSTPEGLHYVLKETILALLRHPDYCISGHSSTNSKRNSDAGEELFNKLSLEERAKFDEETLVNVNNFFRRGLAKSRTSSLSNEYIVVTVLIAAEGEFKLPVINNTADLKEALHKLGSIPKDQILAVEVLWTPQDQSDTLLERDLLRDYPLLQSL